MSDLYYTCDECIMFVGFDKMNSMIDWLNPVFCKPWILLQVEYLILDIGIKINTINYSPKLNFLKGVTIF
jgi:hypothetical protein